MDNSTPKTLFKAVHELLLEQNDQRTGKRHTFNGVQLVAPYDGKSPPPQEAFQHVRCRDLSTSGFSYFAPCLPATKQLIVALGNTPFIFFSAEIARMAPGRLDDLRGFWVGCKFIERIN